METVTEKISVSSVSIEDEMRRSYLDYAMSVIIGRALPDARDGFKPVHRRVLWTMHELGNTYNKAYKKSARVTGDCFVKGALVHTENGLAPIEKIEIGDRMLLPNGYTSRVVETYHNPPAPVVEVNLSNGITLTVTPGQLFRVVRDDLSIGWERADQLEGKRVLISSPRSLGQPEPHPSEERMTAAYVAGLLVAEGFLVDRGSSERVGVSMIDKEPLEFVAAYCEQRQVKTSWMIRPPQKPHHQPQYYLRFKGLKEAYAVCEDKCAHKQTPDWILADRRLFAPFIAGFVDGDGSLRIEQSRREIILSSTSELLTTQLQAMLADCGIHAIRSCEDINEKPRTKRTLSHYTLYLSGDMASRFAVWLEPYLKVSRKQEAAVRLSSWHRRVLNTTSECVPSAAIFDELSKHHLGAGWYEDKDGKKFRAGIKYPTGAKIRYSSDLKEKTLSYRQIETWGILTKLERIGSSLAERLKKLIDGYCVLKVVSVTNRSELAETFDIQIEHESHEFLLHGCAVSNCLGKYHPHGDVAVYDTIVRMAQDFSLRYPLIDGQGNFGCFTGDTKIKLLDGTEKTFAELSSLPPDEVFFVYSVDKNGRVCIGEGRNSRVTRKNAGLIELALDSGAKIRCTPDHRFLLRNGTYKQAENLTAADSLMPGYFDTAIVKEGLNDYLRVWQPKAEQYEFVHHLADEFNERRGQPRTSGKAFVRHHKNFNFEDFSRAAQNYNHRVISVERLAERADVYDITVEEHHNFLLASGVFVHNSIDGDAPAAQRYTEVRMSRLTNEMLSDIEKETVDFRPNYDESLSEPSVLPARVPNLLLNGSDGIAVGMATKIPPHNLTEIVDATIAIVKRPAIKMEEILKLVPGPDFPTAGFIYGREGIRQAYLTGRGIVQMRARAGVDRIGRGGTERDAIIITEIPYQVNKARLIERIAELVNEKKIEGISDLRDESNRVGMRIVVELKRDAVPQIVLNKLYKLTPMQSSFGINNLAIVGGQPRVLNLKQMLETFVDFRREVVRRRTEFELRRARARAHILEGLNKAIDALDYIIPLIRNARSVDEARQWLTGNFTTLQGDTPKSWKGVPADLTLAGFLGKMQKTIARLQFSELQSQAILDLQLRRLSALERQKILDEYEAIIRLIAELEEILSNENSLRAVIVRELEAVKRDFGDKRRTEIVDEGVDLTIEDLISDEDVAITVTNSGYIKRTPVTAYTRQGRGGKGKFGASTGKNNDFVEHLFIASTHSYLMMFTDDGQVHKLKVHELPDADRASRGKAFVNLVNIPSSRKLVGVIPVRNFSEDRFVVMVTRKGVIKKTALSDFKNINVRGINAVNVDEGDELLDVVLTDGTKQILIATHAGLAIRFNEADARAMGRSARGTRGMTLREGDFVVAVCAVSADGNERMLSVSEQGYGKQTRIADYRLQSRGGRGVINMKTNAKTGKVVAVFPVEDDSEVMIITQQGKLIRIEAGTVRKTGRSASGVRLIKTDETDQVTSASLLEPAVATAEDEDASVPLIG